MDSNGIINLEGLDLDYTRRIFDDVNIWGDITYNNP